MRSGIMERTEVGGLTDREDSNQPKIQVGSPSSAAGDVDTNARGIVAVPVCVALMLAAGGCPSASWPHACGIAAI